MVVAYTAATQDVVAVRIPAMMTQTILILGKQDIMTKNPNDVEAGEAVAGDHRRSISCRAIGEECHSMKLVTVVQNSMETSQASSATHG